MTTLVQRIKPVLAAALLCLAGPGSGCSDDGGTGADSGARADAGAEAGPPRVDREIGKACADNAQCALIPSGYCDSSDNTCTRKCDTNQDCGCAKGTTEADIAQGRCRAACVFTVGVGFCFRACQKTADCASGARCNPLAGTSFSICE
jgi:hypothetical protein